MGDVSMANLLTKQSLPTKDGFAHAVRFTVASAAAQTVPAKGRIISLHSRSHAVGARGSRVFSLVLLLFLVFPVSTSTSADATCPLPEALPLIFGLNTGQTSFEVKFLSPPEGLSVSDMLAAKVGGDRNLTGGKA